MPDEPIYLDHAASALLDPQVAAAMCACLTDAAGYGNSSNFAHPYGRRAAAKIEAARAEVARLIGATAPSILFTSGATESDNLGVLGAGRANAARGLRHVITARTEHKAVLAACQQLEREGLTVTYLAPGADGRVTPGDVEAAWQADTGLVALMLVNNETGVLQDIAAIGQLTRARDALLHVDAVQAVGHIPVHVDELGADLLALSAHKLHGPTGVGALYVRRSPRPALVPLQFGGGHEQGLRSGTLSVHQIVGLGEACRLAAARLATEPARQAALTERLWLQLQALGGLIRNGEGAPRAPHILSVTFTGVDGEALRFGLQGLAVSGGSSCSSGSGEPSYVLRALGRSDVEAVATVRFSVGCTTSEAEIDSAARQVAAECRRLRELAPAGA